MPDKTPIDGEYGLDYQIHVLRLMVNELPIGIRESILKQLDEIIKAVAIRQRLIISLITPKLEDIRVDVEYLEFDRQATKQERDDLSEKLRDILGE
jgi:hypothetical protein